MAATATIASGSQNQDAASTAPTAALANAPQKASSTEKAPVSLGGPGRMQWRRHTSHGSTKSLPTAFSPRRIS